MNKKTRHKVVAGLSLSGITAGVTLGIFSARKAAEKKELEALAAFLNSGEPEGELKKDLPIVAIVNDDTVTFVQLN